MRILALMTMLMFSTAQADPVADAIQNVADNIIGQFKAAQATCELARQTQNLSIATLANALVLAGNNPQVAVQQAASALYLGNIPNISASGMPSLVLYCGDLDIP